jgi:hypothetical protein
VVAARSAFLSDTVAVTGGKSVAGRRPIFLPISEGEIMRKESMGKIPRAIGKKFFRDILDPLKIVDIALCCYFGARFGLRVRL